MEVLRDCQSPIELNSFSEDMNDKAGKVSPEKQAMIPANDKEHSLHNNNTNKPVTSKRIVLNTC